MSTPVPVSSAAASHASQAAELSSITLAHERELEGDHQLEGEHEERLTVHTEDDDRNQERLLKDRVEQSFPQSPHIGHYIMGLPAGWLFLLGIVLGVALAFIMALVIVVATSSEQDAFTAPVTCPAIPNPNYGLSSCADWPTVIGHGYTCDFECGFGYTLNGPEKLVCLDTGSWSGSPPVCSP